MLIIGNFSLFNSQYFHYNLTRRFDFLPKSSSGVNWGRTLRGDSKISVGHAYCLLYPGGWFARSMDSQHPGSSKPMSLLNLLLSGVICMCRASLIFNSRFLLALSTTLTSSCLMGWCCCQDVQKWLKPSHHLSYKHPDVLLLSVQAF